MNIFHTYSKSLAFFGYLEGDKCSILTGDIHLLAGSPRAEKRWSIFYTKRMIIVTGEHITIQLPAIKHLEKGENVFLWCYI